MIKYNEEEKQALYTDYIINGFTRSEMMAKYNMTRKVLVNRLNFYDIKKPLGANISKEDLYELYVNQNLGIKQIMEIYGCRYGQVRVLLRKYNIHKVRGEGITPKPKKEKKLVVKEEKQVKLKEPKKEKAVITKVQPDLTGSTKLHPLKKRMIELLRNNKFSYDMDYKIVKDGLEYVYDFVVFGNNKKPVMLLDCQPNGYILSNKQRNIRKELIPDGCKFEAYVEGKEEETQKKILKLINVKYDKFVSNLFKKCREGGFPYPEDSDEIIKQSYNELMKGDVNKFSVHVRYGEYAILAAHKSIWDAKKEGQEAPVVAWNDDALLIKTIKNRIIYKGAYILTPAHILKGLTITRKATRVSVFNAFLAKYLIKKYLNEYDTIFDPCSGYSGRMLGACAAGKKYIGQDINDKTISESERLKKVLNLNAELTCGDSLTTTGEYKCLFTCSPYNLKETWGQEINDMSCDGWIDSFMKNYKCEHYLFVVDETRKYQDHIIETIENKSHFGTNCEYVIYF